MDEDHILGFDEIEVSKEDTKCKLAEKWIPKTVVDSELQVSITVVTHRIMLQIIRIL